MIGIHILPDELWPLKRLRGSFFFSGALAKLPNLLYNCFVIIHTRRVRAHSLIGLQKRPDGIIKSCVAYVEYFLCEYNNCKVIWVTRWWICGFANWVVSGDQEKSAADINRVEFK